MDSLGLVLLAVAAVVLPLLIAWKLLARGMQQGQRRREKMPR